MGIKYTLPHLTTRQIILPYDDAIGEGADYAAYANTGDEVHLRLTGTPIRWEIRPLTVSMVQTLAMRTKWAPEELASAMRDPEWAKVCVRYIVCGVSGLGPDWPKPAMVQEAGEKILSWEIIRGLCAATPNEGMNALAILVMAAIALHDQVQSLAPK